MNKREYMEKYRNEKKAEISEWQKKYRKERIAELIASKRCTQCGAPGLDGCLRMCINCRVKNRKRIRAKISAVNVCVACQKQCDLVTKRCQSCLDYARRHNAKSRNTAEKKLIVTVRSMSRCVARGFASNKRACLRSKHFEWTHGDFIKKFPSFTPLPECVIDHIIPLKCAFLPGGSIDREFLFYALGIKNIRVTNHSENTIKGSDFDARCAQASNLYRKEKGLFGKDLFAELWREIVGPEFPHLAECDQAEQGD